MENGALGDIPIISLKSSNVTQEIKCACENVGFFIITDHGVPEDLMNQHWEECFQFWNRLPQSLVVNNITESPFVWMDFSGKEQNQYIIGPTPGRQGMSWKPDTKKMENLWKNYYVHMEELYRKLMEIMALSLNLDQYFFNSYLTHHNSPLRTVYYPPKIDNINSNLVRAGEHTDWGCLTILLQDKFTSGLQIKMHDSTWRDAPIVDNGFIVNLGDLLPRWTNNKWKATAHRVVASETTCKRGRLTIPFFGLVNSDSLISCITSDENPKFEPIKAEDFFNQHEKFSIYL